MDEEKNEDYYLEKLKTKGFNVERYMSERTHSSDKYETFPNEKVFINWVIQNDFGAIGLISDELFSIYSNPTSEENIVVNKYVKENDKVEDVSKLSDECLEIRLYLLDVLTSLNTKSTEDLVNIHEETADKLEKIRERLNSLIKGSLEYFKKQENEEGKEHYIG